MNFDQAFGLGLLFAINTLNFLDRMSIAAVLTQIQKHFHISAMGQGLLSSCFLGGYMLTAPIFGYLGDRYSRKWIIIGGVSFWCLAAYSGSLVPPEYKALFFISRTLVGVGEASYSTVAPTIIADLFKKEQRKIALSAFYFAIPIGTGLGFVIGGFAMTLGNWKYILYFTPAIGIVCIGLLLFLNEPVRGATEIQDGLIEKDDATILENIQYLFKIKSYVFSTLGFTCCLFATGALSWWAISFFKAAVSDSYETQATYFFGGIICLAGLVGVTIGSLGAQAWKKYDERADALLCAGGVFLAVPFTLFGLITARDVTSLSWLLMFLSITSLSTNWAVISDMVLSVTMPTRRAFATAIQILVSHLLGDASSPFIIGGIKDMLHDNYDYSEYSSFLYALLTLLIPLTLSSVLFLFSAKYYAEDVKKARNLSPGYGAGGANDNIESQDLQPAIQWEQESGLQGARR